MKRVTLLGTLSIGLAVGFLSGAAITVAYTDQQKFNYDQVIAQAGETTVTRSQLAERAIAKIGTRLLEEDLKRQAYLDEVARRKGITVTKAEIDQRIKEYKGLLENYKEMATLTGIKKESVDSIPTDVLQEEFRKVVLAEKAMGVTVSDADIEKTFFDNLKRLYQPPMVKLICISTKTETDAIGALNRLKDGEDPRVVSEQTSSDKDIINARGELGWFPQSAMSQQVSEAIFNVNGKALRAKQFTGVLKIDNIIDDPITGQRSNRPDYVIFYVEDTKASKEVKLADVRPVVAFVARYQKVADTEREWLLRQGDLIEWKEAKNLANPTSELQIMKDPFAFLRPKRDQQ